MPASRVVYYDKEGNEQIFIGNPKNFKLPKGSSKERPEPKPFKNKLALKGGGRAYGRNS